MKYFDLVPGDNQWTIGEDYYFADGSSVSDVWALGRCTLISDVRPRPFQIIGTGRVVDFNLTTYMGIVVSDSVADLLQIAIPKERMQLLPASIAGDTNRWFALNVLDRVDCIDFGRSDVFFHDNSNPKKAGKPRSIQRLVIDPAQAEGHDLFRLADWEMAVIVSERLMKAFNEAGITGIEYWQV